MDDSSGSSHASFWMLLVAWMACSWGWRHKWCLLSTSCSSSSINHYHPFRFPCTNPVCHWGCCHLSQWAIPLWEWNITLLQDCTKTCPRFDHSVAHNDKYITVWKKNNHGRFWTWCETVSGLTWLFVWFNVGRSGFRPEQQFYLAGCSSWTVTSSNSKWLWHSISQ